LISLGKIDFHPTGTVREVSMRFHRNSGFPRPQRNASERTGNPGSHIEPRNSLPAPSDPIWKRNRVGIVTPDPRPNVGISPDRTPSPRKGGRSRFEHTRLRRNPQGRLRPDGMKVENLHIHPAGSGDPSHHEPARACDLPLRYRPIPDEAQ